MTVASSLAPSCRAISAQILASSSLLPASATPRQSRSASLAVSIAFAGIFSNCDSATNRAIFPVISMISSSECFTYRPEDDWSSNLLLFLIGLLVSCLGNDFGDCAARRAEFDRHDSWITDNFAAQFVD